MASSSGAKLTLMVKNGDAAANHVPYPPVLATYEDLVINPRLFMETLEKLHSVMGTKFMIPIIGGKDLDLHRLFVEVTSRGGFEKIMRERRWKEVTTVFNFPATATNASFVLRKYYKSLLHHFEQIYFFKVRRWVPSPDSLQSIPYPPVAPQVSTEELPRRTEFSPGATSATGSATGNDSQVIGVIDGKFENGFLVSVTIGTEKLKGVLYTSSPNPSPLAPHHRSASQNRNASPTSKNESAPGTSPALRRRRRKKSEMKKRDPAHPKPNCSGYNFFFAEQHARLKPLYAGKDREISRMIGELWTNMKEPEKAVYQEKAANDKVRYQTEMKSYMERLRTGQIIDAVPLQQLPLEHDPSMVGPSEGTDDLDHESEWDTSVGNEIGSEDVPMEEKLLNEEGSDSVDLTEDVKVTTPCPDVQNVEKKTETGNRNESLEAENTCCESKDIKLAEEEKGEKEKSHKAEDKSLANGNSSMTMHENKSADIEKEQGGDDVVETKKRPFPDEDEGLTSSEKRQKAEDEV